MSSVGYATLQVIPSMKGFGSNLSSGIGPEMDAAGKSGGQRFGAGLSSSASGFGSKAGRVLGLGVLGGLGVAIAGIGAVLKTGFGEAMDASAGTAQLTAGIKSTGNAAGVSVKGINDLASSIQGYSGQTDDSIVASAKLLLTFTNIKNQGPDKIFDQATTASANMAAKMGGDASGAAIQLGKALNDPVKGISALSRVGVSFSEGQKKSIEAMVKHGDVAGAQKVILAELNKEFGGAAKAAGESLPGQLAKSKRAFEDVSQSVVEGLIPVVTPALTSIGTNITTKVIPAIQSFVQGFKDGSGAGGTFRDALSTTGAVLSTVAGFIKQNSDFLVPFAAVILTVVAGVRIWTGVQAALNIVMALNPIGIVVIAIAALIAGLVMAYQRSETFRAGVDIAFNGIKTIIGNVISVVITIIRGLLTAWTTVIGGILSAAATIAEKLHLPFAKSMRQASDSFNTMAKAADDKLKGVADSASHWGEATGQNYALGIGRHKELAAVNAGAIAAGVKHALVVPSAQALGKAVADGMAAGIRQHKQLAILEAQSMAAGVKYALHAVILPGSPSRMTAKLGVQIGQGLVVGMNSTKAQVAAAATKLADVIAAKLDAAKGKLADALSLRNDFAKSVSASIIGFGNVTSAQAGESGSLTADDVVKQLQVRLVAVKRFVSDMARLKTSGLNKTSYEQIINAGVESGGSVAAALAGGGRGAVSSINSIQSQIAQQGANLGGAASKALFQAGVDSAQGLLQGLQSQASALAAAASGLGKALVAAIKKTLGIKSPSRVFAELGLMTGQGFALGLAGSQSDVDAAMRSLVSSPRSGSMDFSSADAIASAVGSSGADRQPIVLMIDKREIGRVVVDVNNADVRRNGVSGLR